MLLMIVKKFIISLQKYIKPIFYIMYNMGQKSPLARTLDYWTRQARRVAILLLGIIVIILILIALFYLIPILIEQILGAF